MPAVYGVVKQNAGNIWVYSEPSQGTTFKIYLPRIDSEIKPLVQPKQPASHIAAAGQTILVVDDNDAVRVAISAYLEMNSFRVLQASDGKDAIQVASLQQNRKNRHAHHRSCDAANGRIGIIPATVKRYPALKVLYMSGYTENP